MTLLEFVERFDTYPEDHPTKSGRTRNLSILKQCSADDLAGVLSQIRDGELGQLRDEHGVVIWRDGDFRCAAADLARGIT